VIAPGAHPGREELAVDAPSAAVAAHLGGCAECRVERRLLRAGPPPGAGPAPRGLLDAARAAAGAEPSSEAPRLPGLGPEPLAPATEPPAGPRYELGERLGVGSSAVVHRAYDPALRRHVALKVSTREAPVARARFLAEAQITAQLDHPHIIPIYHLGVTEDGRPYVAEREVRGESLTAAVRSGRLATLDHRVDALRKVCSAVAHAHAHGVLHRDLKPDNVMVGEYGEVQVVDWGLSRPLGASPDPDAVHADRFDSPAHRTRDGQIAGTPAWMAPEQARGEVDRLDARTDVYALGAMLFFLTVGRPPVTDVDPRSVLAAVAAGHLPSPRDVDRSVPRELDAVVRKAMAPDPDARYRDVRSLLQDLDAWSARRPLPHVGSRLLERWEKYAARNRTTLRAVTATVAVALAAAGLGGWRYVSDIREARDDASAEAARARDAERRAIVRAAETQVALADAARRDGRERAAAAALARATAALRAAGGDLRDAEWARSALVAAQPPPLSVCAPAGRHSLRAVAVAPDGRAALALDDDGGLVGWDPAGCAIASRDTFGAPPVEGDVAWLPDGPAAVAWIGRELVHRRPGGEVVARTPLPDALFGPGGEPDRTDVAPLVLHPWGEGALAAPDGRWWTFRFGEPGLRAEVPFVDRPRFVSLVPGGRDVFAYVGFGHIEARGLYDRPTLTLREPYWLTTETTSDGRRALADTRDGAHAVDLATRELLWATPETPYGEVGVAPGDRYAWHALGGVIQVYALGTGAVVGRVVAPVDEGLVAVSTDARLLLTASPAGDVSTWLRAEPRLRRFAEEASAERGPRLATSPDGTLLAVSGHRGFEGIELVDLATGASLRRLPAGDFVNHLGFSPAGDHLVASTIEAGIVAFDVASGAEVWRRPLPPNEQPVEWVGDEVVTVDGAGDLVVLGGPDGVERRRFPLLRGDSVDLDAVPGTRRVVVGSYVPEPPSAAVVDLDTGEIVHRLDDAENRAQIAVSPDGARAVLAGWTGRTVVWDLRTGAVTHTLQAESGPTIGAAFSPDGSVLATSSWDEQLVLWDPDTGARLRTVSLGRKGGFLSFTADGSLLATTWSWKIDELPLDAHLRREAAVEALQGTPLDRARAFAALGWWERVLPELARGEDDPRLRAQAWLAARNPAAAAAAAEQLPDGVYRRVLLATPIVGEP
jgi:hypothetical protein